MELTELLGIELPIVQAPMAVAQDSAMAIAVSNAGGLGSLPCAMLTADGLRKELESIKSQTNKPINVNFFCHGAPDVDAERQPPAHGQSLTQSARRTRRANPGKNRPDGATSRLHDGRRGRT